MFVMANIKVTFIHPFDDSEMAMEADDTAEKVVDSLVDNKIIPDYLRGVNLTVIRRKSDTEISYDQTLVNGGLVDGSRITIFWPF
jgi:hypothetical protein